MSQWHKLQKLANSVKIISQLLKICFFRAVDFALHKDDAIRRYREDWPVNEPRLWAVGILAYFYVLVFLRVLGYTKTNRTLGPLRITLSKMLGDVFQFFAFFCLIMFAFAIGLSELFWYYSSARNKNAMCSQSNNQTSHGCKNIPFSNLWPSLMSLFWGIFGYLDPNDVDIIDTHNNLEVLGLILLAGFYVAVALILINMLIAMMSKSYEVTSEHNEEVWRFYRAVIWVRYIRGDFTSPPPMNLIPNIHFICKKLKVVWHRKIFHIQRLNDRNAAVRREVQLESFTECDSTVDSLTKHTNTLVLRYKLHKLLGNSSILPKRASNKNYCCD